MTAVRKPKPRAVPTTLAELVLDLDSRLEGESVACDVWLPAEEWERLLARAVDERHPAPNFGPVAPDEKVGLEYAELLGQRQLEREDLAKALGCGVDTEWPDLVQIAKGYAMALEVERERYVRRVAELGNQATLRPADRPDEDEHPEDCRECAKRPFVLRVNGVELAGHYEDRDFAEQDGRRRCSGGFEVYEPRKQRVWDSYTRCETCGEVTDGHVTSSCPKAKVEEPEEEHPDCPHCGEADGHKPEDCAAREDDRPTMVESMAKAELEQAAARARPKKRRATKKFPLGGDPLELCTVCGAPFGEHDGQRCPKKQRRMKYVDEPTDRKSVV